jgi:anthranilate synthase component 1
MSLHLTIHPSLEEFRALSERGNLIPVHTELIADAETPVSAFRKLDRGGHSFLLESAEVGGPHGRYSLVGTNPRAIFESRGRSIRIVEGEVVREFETARDPLTELQELMGNYCLAAPPRQGVVQSSFSGGAIGYLAYDMVRFFEPIGEPAKDELDLPESLFLITDTVLIFDHRTRGLRIVNNAVVANEAVEAAYDRAVRAIEEVVERLSQPGDLPPLPARPSAEPIVPRCNTTREEYEGMVRAMQEYIHAGDVFQIVPSQRFETEYPGDPLTLYRTLRFVNPSPYMFCLKFGKRFALVGSSPEVHVRAIDRQVEIRPIAGTKRRGADEAEDTRNAEALLADPKERAEHLMLVDLARNDVGRIADFGTVQVTDFMKIEKYSHVMHIVSNVLGRLHADRNAYDVMRATFPAGTVSGSPKVRAMQIINQFEKSKRCVYAGAVGYFGFDGNSDSCIALRTVTLKDGIAYVQTGAGVVADSTPEGEYQECVNKAMGTMAAIAQARGNL